MSSTAKTLELLSFFSDSLPEIGLSQMCRLARRDKATTYRHLQSLVNTGFMEQNSSNKNYRLGPVLLKLAQTREATVPRKSGAEAPLRSLADALGETAHVSVLSDQELYPIISCDSSMHSTRVIIDVATLPLHATASGLCALAFGPAKLIETASKKLRVYTPSTISTIDDLNAAIDLTRSEGIAIADSSMESDVCSLAAPLFDQTGLFAGVVSVASVATRFTPDLERSIRQNLVNASREITRNWGGAIPTDLESTWAKSHSLSHV